MSYRRRVTTDLLLRGRAALALALAILLCGPDVQAAEPSAHAAHATRRLERARESARRFDYTGIVLYQQGPESHTSRMIHTSDLSGGMMRVQSLEGEQRELIQRDGRLTWYLPRERIVIHDQRAGTQSFPTVSFSSAGEWLVHYRSRTPAADRVAGRDAELIELQPLDGFRYGYRFWFDVATGLLLRVQSISETGQVVAQTGFSQLAVGPASVKRFRWHPPDVRGWKAERAIISNADTAGWSLRLPAGFSQIAAFRRIMGKSPDSAAQSREVLQLVCSDGLAGISIFIEPWSEARSVQPLQRGAVNMLGKRVAGFWLTIVGETPMAALRLVADSLEFTAPAIK